MRSKYGFQTEAEAKQAQEQQERENQALYQTEIERVDPLIREVLEDFSTACGLDNCIVSRVNEQWLLMQNEQSLITATLKFPDPKDNVSSLYVDDLGVGAIQEPYVRSNRKKLFDVLQDVLGIEVRNLSRL